MRAALRTWAYVEGLLEEPKRYLWVLGGLCVVAVGASWLGVYFRYDLLSELAPSNHGEGQLDAMWQVLATFVAVAFAGIAVMFQIVPQDPSFAVDRRVVVVKWAFVQVTLVVGTTCTITVGAIALWFPSDAAVAASFLLLFVPALLLALISYLRFATVYVHPEVIAGLAEQIFLKRLTSRVDTHVQAIAASEALFQLDVKDEILWSLTRPTREPSEFRSTVTLMTARVDMRVLSIDAARISSLATLVRNSSTVDAYEPGAQPARQMRLVVTVAPGDIVRAGQPILSIEFDGGISEAPVTRWMRRARNCVQLEPMEVADRDTETLRVLCSGIETSIRDGRLNDASLGLVTFRRLLRALVERAGTVGDDRSSLEGVESVRAMAVGLYGIGEVAASQGSRSTSIVAAAVEGIAFDALKANHVGAWRFALRQLESLWSDGLKSGLDEDAFRYLTVQLTSLHDFVASSRGELTGPQRERFRLEVLLSLTQALRQSLDAGDEPSIKLASDAFDQIQRMYMFDPESTSSVAVAGYRLVLLAWELLRQANGAGDPDARRRALDAARAISHEQLEEAFRFALGQVDHGGPITWWESELHRSGEAHWVQFPHQVRVAAVLAGLSAEHLKDAGEWTADDASLARILLGTLRSLDEATLLRLEIELSGDSDRVAELTRALETQIELYDRNEQAALAVAELNAESVERFGRLIVGAAPSPGGLLAAMLEHRSPGASVEGTSLIEWARFRFRAYFPRVFFIPTDATIAEPDAVAKLCADQLHARMEEMMLGGLLVSTSTGEASVQDLTSIVLEASAKTPSLLIVVLNSRYAKGVVDSALERSGSDAARAFVSTDDETSEVLLVELDTIGVLEMKLPEDTQLRASEGSMIAWEVTDPQQPVEGPPAAVVTVATDLRWVPGRAQVVRRIRLTDAPW